MALRPRPSSVTTCVLPTQANGRTRVLAFLKQDERLLPLSSWGFRGSVARKLSFRGRFCRLGEIKATRISSEHCSYYWEHSSFRILPQAWFWVDPILGPCRLRQPWLCSPTFPWYFVCGTWWRSQVSPVLKRNTEKWGRREKWIFPSFAIGLGSTVAISRTQQTNGKFSACKLKPQFKK